jgi:hypothetical protein
VDGAEERQRQELQRRRRGELVGQRPRLSGLRERERIREAFGTYVDREVAEQILRRGPRSAGEEVEVTMLFLDIRGYTSFAERLSTPDVVAMLTAYSSGPSRSSPAEPRSCCARPDRGRRASRSDAEEKDAAGCDL